MSFLLKPSLSTAWEIPEELDRRHKRRNPNVALRSVSPVA